MTKERAELEAERELERQAAWDKRYTTALTKAYKQTKALRDQRLYRSKGVHKRWKIIMRELVARR